MEKLPGRRDTARNRPAPPPFRAPEAGDGAGGRHLGASAIQRAAGNAAFGAALAGRGGAPLLPVQRATATGQQDIELQNLGEQQHPAVTETAATTEAAATTGTEQGNQQQADAEKTALDRVKSALGLLKASLGEVDGTAFATAGMAGVGYSYASEQHGSDSVLGRISMEAMAAGDTVDVAAFATAWFDSLMAMRGAWNSPRAGARIHAITDFAVKTGKLAAVVMNMGRRGASLEGVPVPSPVGATSFVLLAVGDLVGLVQRSIDGYAQGIAVQKVPGAPQHFGDTREFTALGARLRTAARRRDNARADVDATKERLSGARGGRREELTKQLAAQRRQQMRAARELLHVEREFESRGRQYEQDLVQLARIQQYFAKKGGGIQFAQTFSTELATLARISMSAVFTAMFRGALPFANPAGLVTAVAAAGIGTVSSGLKAMHRWMLHYSGGSEVPLQQEQGGQGEHGQGEHGQGPQPGGAQGGNSAWQIADPRKDIDSGARTHLAGDLIRLAGGRSVNAQIQDVAQQILRALSLGPGNYGLDDEAWEERLRVFAEGEAGSPGENADARGFTRDHLRAEITRHLAA